MPDLCDLLVCLQAHLLRINLGNIYFEQQKYPVAIKMYRMALDQVPLTSRSVRSKILRNIGVAFMRVGQYQAWPLLALFLCMLWPQAGKPLLNCVCMTGNLMSVGQQQKKGFCQIA